MKITIITADKKVIIDGYGVTIPDLNLPNIWALRFDTATGIGEIEPVDKSQPNYSIDSVEDYKSIIEQAIDLKKQQVSQYEAALLAEEQRKLNWSYKRQQDYGTWDKQLEMIYDKGIDAWKDHIATIKTRYPKT